MKTITKPMSKLDKVVHLLKIAENLKILKDSHFDTLMDMFEQNKHYFDYFAYSINMFIIEKKPIEDTKLLFLAFIENKRMGDVYNHIILNKFNTDLENDQPYI